MAKKGIIFFAFVLALSFARDIDYLGDNSHSLDVNGRQTEIIQDNPILPMTRENIMVIEEDFEGDVEWTHENWWELSENDYNSPTHSFNAVNPPNGVNVGSWNLYSPVYQLPELGEDEVMRFGFHLFCDQPDSDGDGDNSLEDLYRVALADVDALAWHTSDFMAYEGMSYWCGDEALEGYSDGWLQFLDTPPVTIPAGGYTMTADLRWGLEDPCGGDCGVAGVFVDGWDAANVRISADGGQSWDILAGSDPYDFTSGYGWVFNGEDEYIAGWGGQTDWHEVTFDLNDYAGEEVIIRFAFGSDPGYSTIDDASLTGFSVDNIVISNDLFLADADANDPMIAAGLAWVEQFYDYSGDDANPRPGHFGWEEYLPGLPYNGNTFLDISDFGGRNVQFRFQAVYDDNDDGGVGTGLFIDDFKVYIELGAPPAPTGLAGEALDSQVNLWWDDMNYAGTDDYIYDNDMITQMITLTDEGEAWAGTAIDLIGPSTINTVSIYNINEPGVTITLGAFEKVGSFYNTSPAYEMEVTLGEGWNDFSPAWDVTNNFLIGITFTDQIAAGLDESVDYSYHSYTMLGGSWDSWAETVEGSGGGLNHGEWGIRANVTAMGADVTYNVYRDGDPVSTLLSNASFTDTGLENNITYGYQVSAVFPGGEESELSEELQLTPQANTVYELLYDDGTAEEGANYGSNNFMAVKFTSNGDEDDMMRVKWYQMVDGGAFYIYLWEDDGGMPGMEMYHHVVVGGVEGWNDYDLTSEAFVMGGDFWVGVKEFTSTAAFGLDTNSNAGMGYGRIGTTGAWQPLADIGFDGNLMLRAVLNGEEQTGCEIGDVNTDGSVDVLDIVMIVNFIMGQTIPNDDQQCAADANEDGAIDVLDIVQIVNMIMGG